MSHSIPYTIKEVADLNRCAPTLIKDMRSALDAIEAGDDPRMTAHAIGQLEEAIGSLRFLWRHAAPHIHHA